MSMSCMLLAVCIFIRPLSILSSAHGLGQWAILFLITFPSDVLQHPCGIGRGWGNAKVDARTCQGWHGDCSYSSSSTTLFCLLRESTPYRATPHFLNHHTPCHHTLCDRMAWKSIVTYFDLVIYLCYVSASSLSAHGIASCWFSNAEFPKYDEGLKETSTVSRCDSDPFDSLCFMRQQSIFFPRALSFERPH